MLYKAVLTFEWADEILNCEHSTKVIEQYFPVVLFIMLYKVVLTFETFDSTEYYFPVVLFIIRMLYK